MNIDEALTRISEWSDSAVLYAARIDGKFRPESPSKILSPEIGQVVRRIDELDYFLEVDIIKDILAGWTRNHQGRFPSQVEAAESVIFYAENDAYPEAFFGP